jgi:CheY-like chemotaxis protein
MRRMGYTSPRSCRSATRASTERGRTAKDRPRGGVASRRSPRIGGGVLPGRATAIMNTSAMRNEVGDQWLSPLAHVSMADHARRERIAGVLEGAGWTVVLHPTGFHLLQAIADVIEGRTTGLRPGLIVMDTRARGCAGTTIAAGLRDLGISIPIVLVAAPSEAIPLSPDRTLRLVDAASADAEVAALAAVTSKLAVAPTRPAA